MRAVVLAALLFVLMVSSAPANVVIGVAGDEPTVASVQRLGVPVAVHATFEAWSLDRTPEGALDIATQLGVTPMISWEPWQPNRPGDRRAGQPQYSDTTIAAGARDEYVRRFARALAVYGRPVYLRFAHEMNGKWYPWGIRPAEFRAAWRHVWRVMRREGATNVRWVWSVNLNTYENDREFARRAKSYWPGARYVDLVGSTLVRFRFQGAQGIDWSLRRLDLLHKLVPARPVWLTETKVDARERYPWLRELSCGVHRRPWIRGLVWSETRSRAQAKGASTGEMDWSLMNDTRARALLARIGRGGSCR